MLGKTVQLANNLWFIHGEMPEDASKAPDWCNVVVYRAADRVYLIDSGGGTAMRASIRRILNEVGAVETFTLVNTHAHLDHICNNDVISSVDAKTKHHLLGRAAIASVALGSSYWADQFDYLDHYFDPFTSYQTHRHLYRAAALLRDSLGALFGRKRVLRWLSSVQLRKFKPANDSRITMEPLDALPSRPLCYNDMRWTGWSLGLDDVHVLDGGGHAAGDVLVYIPEHRMLCMGDVTFPLFPTFRDSSRDKILSSLQKSLAMSRDGTVHLLADGHGDRCYGGQAAIQGLLDQLISDHQEYERILWEIFETADGLTPRAVYEAFKTFSDRPVVNRYLSIEFPRTPPSLQNVMVTTLLQLGFEARGAHRNMRFYRPVRWGP